MRFGALTSFSLLILLSLGPAAHAETAQSLLNKLPAYIRENSQSMFSANPIGQVALNGQYSDMTLKKLLSTVRSELTRAGYCEEPIRTVLSRGSFSATWAPPKGTSVDGVGPGKYAVLSTQAVMLGQSTVNLNTSFVDVLAGDQAGVVSQLFPVRDLGNEFSLRLVRQFTGVDSPILGIYPEQRRKGFAVLSEDRELTLFHSTSGSLVSVLRCGTRCLEVVLSL